MAFIPNPLGFAARADIDGTRLVLRDTTMNVAYWDDRLTCDTAAALDITQVFGRGAVSMNPRWWRLDDLARSDQIEGARNARLTFLGDRFAQKLQKLEKQEHGSQPSNELARERALYDTFAQGGRIQLIVPFRSDYREKLRKQFREFQRVDYIAPLILDLCYRREPACP